jgi:hypothetical protein
LVYRDMYRSCINRRPCSAIGSVYPAKSLNLVILMFNQRPTEKGDGERPSLLRIW